MPRKNSTNNRQPFLLLITFALFLTGIPVTKAKDLYTADYKHSSTSDAITLNTYTLSYINNRREQFWPYVEEATSGFDWGIILHRYTGQATGIEFTGQQGEAVFGWRFSKSAYVSTNLGSHRLDVPSQATETERFTYNAAALLSAGSHIKFNLHAANDYVYPLGLQPAGVMQFLHGQKWQGMLEWTPIQKLRINFTETRWDLSDDNISHDYQANLLYGISPDWPWIWAGLNYEHLGYDETKPNYWTPFEFHSYGFVFDSSFPITNNLTGAVSANISRIKEDMYPLGNGNSYVVGLDYKLTKTQTLRLGFSHIDSKQNNSDWKENTLRVSFNGSL